MEQEKPKRKRIDSFLEEIKEISYAIRNILLRKNAVLMFPKNLIYGTLIEKEFIKSLSDYNYKLKINEDGDYYMIEIRLDFVLDINEGIFKHQNKAYAISSRKKDIFNNRIIYYIKEVYIG